MASKTYRILMLMLFTAISFFGNSQTASNNCGTNVGQQLTVNASCVPVTFDIGTNIGTPAVPACNGFSGTGQDGWGWFTATSTSTSVQYTSTAGDAQIFVYSGTCAGLIVEGCADAVFGTGTENAIVTTIPGNIYFVRIVRYSGTTTMTGTLCVSEVTVASNDPCTGAIPIACGSVTSGTTVGATNETVPAGCYNNNTSNSVWYTFVGDGSNVQLSLCSGTTFDTQLAVFTGNCAGLTCLGFNDDGCGLQSQVTFTSTLGVTYYVRVFGYSSGQGPFQLSMNCISTVIPNEDCANAIPLTCPQTVSGSTIGAVPDVIPAGCYIDNTSPGVWYTFVGNGGSNTVSLCGSSFDTQLSVLTGSCGAFTCVSYNDQFCGSQSQVTVLTTLGTVYYVYVYGYFGSNGVFTLTLTCSPPPPPPCTIATPVGCPNISLGADIVLPTCSNMPCVPVTLPATYLATGSTTSYTACSVPYAPYPYNTGTGFSIGIDDIWTTTITLPFSFCFFGVNYTQCTVGSNGLLSFNLAYASPNMVTPTFCPWAFTASCPSAALPLNSIFGVYHDIDPSILCGAAPCGDARYATFGVAPCRVFVVSYDNVPHFSSVCNVLRSSCEIVLYETTNEIEVFIENKPVCASWNSGNALVGIQNATGTVGFTPSTRNTGPWSALNEGWRFTPNGPSNVVVNWYQQGSALGTGATIDVCPTSTTQTYVATATYTKCDGSTLVVSDDIVIQCSQLLLPVEWKRFDALLSPDQSVVECIWVTETENNCAYFSIERSVDGEHWSEIGRVTGSGESLSEKLYSFIDQNPVMYASYYRIKQIDTDGNYGYSEIRSVNRQSEYSMSAFPNPSKDKITIRPWRSSYQARMLEPGGRAIDITCSEAGQMDVMQVVSGLYILEVRDKLTGEIQRIPVLVNH